MIVQTIIISCVFAASLGSPTREESLQPPLLLSRSRISEEDDDRIVPHGRDNSALQDNSDERHPLLRSERSSNYYCDDYREDEEFKRLMEKIAEKVRSSHSNSCCSVVLIPVNCDIYKQDTPNNEYCSDDGNQGTTTGASGDQANPPTTKVDQDSEHQGPTITTSSTVVTSSSSDSETPPMSDSSTTMSQTEKNDTTSGVKGSEGDTEPVEPVESQKPTTETPPMSDSSTTMSQTEKTDTTSGVKGSEGDTEPAEPVESQKPTTETPPMSDSSTTMSETEKTDTTSGVKGSEGDTEPVEPVESQKPTTETPPMSDSSTTMSQTEETDTTSGVKGSEGDTEPVEPVESQKPTMVITPDSSPTGGSVPTKETGTNPSIITKDTTPLSTNTNEGSTHDSDDQIKCNCLLPTVTDCPITVPSYGDSNESYSYDNSPTFNSDLSKFNGPKVYNLIEIVVNGLSSYNPAKPCYCDIGMSPEKNVSEPPTTVINVN